MPASRAAAFALVGCWQVLCNQGVPGSHDLLPSADSLQQPPALPAPGCSKAAAAGLFCFLQTLHNMVSAAAAMACWQALACAGSLQQQPAAASNRHACKLLLQS